jgi:uncharacterized protein YdhG (YjbR/CyaY superfamily)
MKTKQPGSVARSPHDIDDYIAAFPSGVQAHLEQIRARIREVAPNSAETIKYGIPTYVLGENLVHFAAFKSHIGFYPTPSGIEAFRDELSAYKCAKGSVQFPLGQPMPLDLIERIVRFRVREVQAKAKQAAKTGRIT